MSRIGVPIARLLPPGEVAEVLRKSRCVSWLVGAVVGALVASAFRNVFSQSDQAQPPVFRNCAGFVARPKGLVAGGRNALNFGVLSVGSVRPTASSVDN